MIGIRGLSLFQAYYAYLSHYQYATASSPTNSTKLLWVGARIAAFLVISDTINFNIYYSQSRDIVENHIMMKEEYER